MMFDPDGSLDDEDNPIPREFTINFIRQKLDPDWDWKSSIKWLEYVEGQLRLAGEDKLAGWIRRLRQERQALN